MAEHVVPPGQAEPPASAPLTKHGVIAAELREQLRNEPPDIRLPTERELAERFQVSRMTVRQALDQLEAEGRVERVRGSGTFTRLPTVAMGPALTSFSEDMRTRGLRPSSRLLGFTRTVGEPQVLKALGLPPDGEVVWMERLRFADGDPICLEVAQFPVRLLGLLEAADLEQSVHDALRVGGVAPRSVVRHVRAVVADERESRLLNLAPRTPALEVLDVFADASGRPIQHARSRYRYDRYEVQMSTKRIDHH